MRGSAGLKSREDSARNAVGYARIAQLRLAQEGYPVRVYVPFGTAWWAYTARRVGENPANARFVLQALLGQ
jgi:proline dehydrogenase